MARSEAPTLGHCKQLVHSISHSTVDLWVLLKAVLASINAVAPSWVSCMHGVLQAAMHHLLCTHVALQRDSGLVHLRSDASHTPGHGSDVMSDRLHVAVGPCHLSLY